MTNSTSPQRLTRRKLLGGLAAAGATVTLATHVAPNAVADVLSEPQPIDIHAQPITSFVRGQPSLRRFAELEFRGGLVLNSSSPHFGGWSGIAADMDGRTLLAVSDMGTWMSAELKYEGERPTGMVQARIGPLQTRGGRSLENKREQDAESLVLLEGTLERGTVLIGFERTHRIARYAVRDREVRLPIGDLKLPSEARRMQRNQGLEALAVLQAGPFRGSVVAFAERFTRGSGFHTGWIWVRGEPHSLHLKDTDDFNITGAAGLPDGGLLILERHFRWMSGVKMRIRRLSAEEIKPGARVTGRTLLTAGSEHEIDNMEGICVHKGRQGETVVSLISDDNFNRFLQRTVFLQFALAE